MRCVFKHSSLVAIPDKFEKQAADTSAAGEICYKSSVQSPMSAAFSSVHF